MRVGNVMRLRIMLAVFVAGVAVPALLLFNHALGQLKWEAYYDARQSALAAARDIDQRLAALLSRELARDPSQYQFLLPDDSGSGQLRRSALSRLPAEINSVPGLLGHFQVTEDGRLTSPAVPTTEAGRAQVSSEMARRKAVKDSIAEVLTENLLIEPDRNEPAGLRAGESRRVASIAEAEPSSRPANAESDGAESSRFDQLAQPSRQQAAVSKQQAYGRLEDIALDSSFDEALNDADQAAKASAPAAMPVAAADMAQEEKEEAGAAVDQLQRRRNAPAEPLAADDLRVTAFEDQYGGFRFSLLDSGHFVLFRNVWLDGGRQVQGLLIDRQPFLDAVAGDALQRAAPDLPGRLLVAYGGTILASYSAARIGRDYSNPELSGELLYQTRLSPPLSNLELVFVAGNLPLGSSLNLLLWLAGTLGLVLLAGAALIYRLGIQQLRLARQQRDFVSAVSHELKTPLTSIRMYGEMLAQGLAQDERKPEYYQFIFNESERLSRLIENVLQLARLDRNEFELSLVEMSVGELLDQVRSRVSSQVAAAGFELALDADSVGPCAVRVDPDAMAQVFINLVDNACKFSRDAQCRKIEIGARREGGRLALTVRDHGPGIAADQLGRIFELFYRTESELTRETVGTGIGLALVRQLVAGMGGRVDVRQCQPGVEFRILLDAV